MSSLPVAGYRVKTRKTPGLPRVFEWLVAAFGLVLASPLLLLSAIAIKLTSRGPVLFRQGRVGRRGEFFQLYKLRTMHVASDGLEVTARGDSRVTALGRILRATKIDELPELWNVLTGNMSLVGPRPEVPRFVDLKNPLWRKVLQVRPGLTDPVTLALRNEETLLEGLSKEERERFYREAVQPYKLRGYSDYLDRRTWWTDVIVLTQTVIAVALPAKSPPPSLLELRQAVERAGTVTSSRPGIGSRLMIRQVQYLIDIVVLIAAFALAYLLRFDFAIPADQKFQALVQLPYVLAIQIVALLLVGVYSFVWRYVGLREFRAFVEAAVWSGLAVAALRLFLPDSFAPWRVPLSVTVIDTVLGFGGVLGVRVLRRLAYESSKKRGEVAEAAGGELRKVLLVGAGQAGVLAAREIFGRGDTDLQIQGFIDDDPLKQDAVIHGIRVLGTTADLARLVKEQGIRDVVITIAQISRREILRLIDLCRKIPVNVRIIPGLYEILQGKVRVTRIRDVEIEDLLGRDRVYLDEEELGRFLAGKRVAVTGAGGSIGSELVRQIARFKPATLLLIERAEFALFEVDKELRRKYPDLRLVPLVADVGDELRTRSLFATHHPEVVFHAAAHKHVPMMEYNPAEAIKNNILATRLLGEIAGESGVEAFVLISTDKAVRPSSVMGASKRVAELVVQDLAKRYPTRFVAVRFGNVMGSAGSVIPIFREQILQGGPVTVTDPDMRRYFMTIPEAAQLVLQAGAMGEGGEIFILDMGEPVRILDLAIAMISLSGLKPFEEMDIVFTGLRPGEKLFEELELDGEEIAKTRHPKIYIGKLAAFAPEAVDRALVVLHDLAKGGDAGSIRTFFNGFLPEAKLGADATESDAQMAGVERQLDLQLAPTKRDGSEAAIEN